MSFYIAIEGVIGVGKTTLARYLHQEFGGELLLEEFEDNPFLAKFYQDRARYAFQTQIFFLLSRYNQQQRLNYLERPIISDYIFAKDHLFAQLNLSGDELKTYERVYNALAANIIKPNLVIYLRANTPLLMSQIARRDRPYERNMDAEYIEQLRVAYDQFFNTYIETPLLTIDMTNLDFVQNESDRTFIIQQVRSALGYGPQQPVLPGIDASSSIKGTYQNIVDPLQIEATPRRLGDFQRFHHAFDAQKGFSTDVFLNFTLLQEEIGELAKALVQWARTVEHEGIENASTVELRDEFADVLAFLLKLANYVGIDLETAYIEKMKLNQKRSW